MPAQPSEPVETEKLDDDDDDEEDMMSGSYDFEFPDEKVG